MLRPTLCLPDYQPDAATGSDSEDAAGAVREASLLATATHMPYGIIEECGELIVMPLQNMWSWQRLLEIVHP